MRRRRQTLNFESEADSVSESVSVSEVGVESASEPASGISAFSWRGCPRGSDESNLSESRCPRGSDESNLSESRCPRGSDESNLSESRCPRGSDGSNLSESRCPRGSDGSNLFERRCARGSDGSNLLGGCARRNSRARRAALRSGDDLQIEHDLELQDLRDRATRFGCRRVTRRASVETLPSSPHPFETPHE
jgi:hypothetical protein